MLCVLTSHYEHYLECFLLAILVSHLCDLLNVISLLSPIYSDLIAVGRFVVGENKFRHEGFFLA